MKVNLSKYDNSWYDPGQNYIIRVFWFVVNAVFFQNPLVLSSRLKIWLLRIFGAKIGQHVVLKPGINIKYPWNLEIGDNSWIGEKVWLDSLGKISIGDNVCLSQGVYLCTGNHNWSDPTFGLIIQPIAIECGAWIGARSNVLPNVIIARYSVISAGSTISKNTEPFGIYSGNPAVKVKQRGLPLNSSAVR